MEFVPFLAIVCYGSLPYILGNYIQKQIGVMKMEDFEKIAI